MEKLFAFHLSQTEYQKVSQIASRLKIHLEPVALCDYNQPLEAIYRSSKNPLVTPYTGNVPEESLLLMCNFTDKRMDKLLFSLRQAHVAVDFKAALTPTNQKWTFLQLLPEMHREKNALPF